MNLQSENKHKKDASGSSHGVSDPMVESESFVDPDGHSGLALLPFECRRFQVRESSNIISQIKPRHEDSAHKKGRIAQGISPILFVTSSKAPHEMWGPELANTPISTQL